jgi:hypothetical protein
MFELFVQGTDSGENNWDKISLRWRKMDFSVRIELSKTRVAEQISNYIHSNDIIERLVLNGQGSDKSTL